MIVCWSYTLIAVLLDTKVAAPRQVAISHFQAFPASLLSGSCLRIGFSCPILG